MWLLGIEPEPSGRAANALNHEPSLQSSAPALLYHSRSPSRGGTIQSELSFSMPVIN